MRKLFFVLALASTLFAGCATRPTVKEVQVPEPIKVVTTEIRVVTPKIVLPELVAERPAEYLGPDKPATISDTIEAMLAWEDCAINWHDYAKALEEWYDQVRTIINDSNAEMEKVTPK